MHSFTIICETHDLTIGPENAWNEDGATPMADIDLACERVESLGNAIPNFFGIDAETWGTLIQDDGFMKLADNRSYELIEVEHQQSLFLPNTHRYVSPDGFPVADSAPSEDARCGCSTTTAHTPTRLPDC